jgi:hypothetical protein
MAMASGQYGARPDLKPEPEKGVLQNVRAKKPPKFSVADHYTEFGGVLSVYLEGVWI